MWEEKTGPLWFSPACLPYELCLVAIKSPCCLKGYVWSNSSASQLGLNAQRAEGEVRAVTPQPCSKRLLSSLLLA